MALALSTSRALHLAFVLPLALVAINCASISPLMNPPPGHARAHFILLTNLAHFERTTNAESGSITTTSPVLSAPHAWNELVLSWNVQAPAASSVRFEARPVFDLPTASSDFYCLGIWSPNQPPRRSVNGQKDANAEVKTDILQLKKMAERFQVRWVATSAMPGQAGPEITCLGISLLDTHRDAPSKPSLQRVWGQLCDVPQRSQNAYPSGRAWCSPTCVSMVLAWWARQLSRPDLDRDVPEVASAVFDPEWPGTGNWPFNTAYAGSLPGMRGLTVRLEDMTELESWVGSGVPVVCSVSYPVLKGKPIGKGGHLVVCVGFTPTGDPIVNDPWTRLEEGETVRKTFPRARFLAAWQNSQQTAYLIYPQNHPVPGWGRAETKESGPPGKPGTKSSPR